MVKFVIVLAMVFALTTLAIVYIYTTRRKQTNLIPGPWNLPMIGYLHMLDPEKPYMTLSKLADKYGPIFKIKFGMLNAVVISDAKLLKKVLMKSESSVRPPMYLIDRIFNSKGITFTRGHLWKDQRKLVSNFLRHVTKSSVRRNILEQQINNSFDVFMKRVTHDNVVTLDPLEDITHYVSTVSATLFLGRTSANDDICDKLVHEVNNAGRLAALGAALNFLPLLRFLPTFKKQISVLDRAVAGYLPVLNKLIEACRDSFSANESEPDANLIHAFLSQKQKCDSDEIYNMEQLQFLIADIFAAGTETTVSTILWTILHLAKYQEVQNRVRQEIFGVASTRRVEYGDLAKLPYTQAMLAEVARYKTIVPLGAAHYTLDDLHVDNIIIPKDTMILPLLYKIHMDPKVWTQPEEFCPERFICEGEKFRQPEEFLPFQIGKRMCVGEELAKLLVFLFTTNLLQNFRIESADSVDFSAYCGMTLRPKPQKLLLKKI